MNELTLYNYFRSSTSYRVRIALHFKKLAFNYNPVHLVNNGGEQHSPEYRKLNPIGEVPTLVHQGKAISQTFAIIEYLDETYPDPPLYPRTPYMRAKIRQFCENINSFMHPLGNLKVLQYLEQKHNYTQTQKDAWVSHWVTQGLKAQEKILQEFSGSYCFGNEVSVADLFLIPQIFSAERFKIDMSAYPKIQAVNAHCLKQEAFRKAHPCRQVDTPTDSKIP